MEIAVYKSDCNTVGSASSLMGLKLRDTVTINFVAATVTPKGKEILER